MPPVGQGLGALIEGIAYPRQWAIATPVGTKKCYYFNIQFRLLLT